MSQARKREFRQVMPIAEKIVSRLAPYCQKIEIAGSLRRRRPWIGDIEIVALPKMEIQRDLFGSEIGRVNLLNQRLDELMKEGKLAKGHAWGEKYRKAIVTTAQGEEYSVDIFMTEPRNFGNLLAIRTGSSDFSTYLMSHLNGRGLKHTKGQLLDGDGRVVACETEEAFFEAIGHAWVDPAERDEGKWKMVQKWHEGAVTHGLSIKQPWLVGIERLGKRVENRTWKPHERYVGRRLALHASAKPDPLGELAIRRSFGVSIPEGVALGAVTLTALLAGWVHRKNGKVERFGDHPAVREYRFDDWYIEGQFGWVFVDVEVLAEPIPAKGKLGVWRLPPEVANALGQEAA